MRHRPLDRLMLAAQAGTPARRLYADRDSDYSLPYIRTLFSALRAAGGKGELLETGSHPGNGHALAGWTDRWERPVAAFLAGIERGDQ